MRKLLFTLILVVAVVLPNSMWAQVRLRLSTVTGVDTTPPVVTITAPTSSNSFDNGSDSTLDAPNALGGTCTDNVTVSQVTWVNSLGGSGTASLVGGGTSSATWSVTSITLQSGDNVITVTCTDSPTTGNTHTDQLTVTHTPAGGSGCGASCLFETSFTVAEGWEADKFQLQGPTNENDCTGTSGTDFDGEQSGVSKWGDWDSEANGCASIVTAANRTAGNGGRGLRNVVGPNTNNGSGGLKFSWSGVTELWFRYFIRYELGFSWNAGAPHYVKEFDLNNSLSCTGSFSDRVIFGFGQPSSNPFGAFNVCNSQGYTGTITWATVMGGSTGDGNWHCVEGYVKQDTNGSNGVVQGWIDGVQSMNVTTADLGGATNTFIQANILTNQDSVTNAADANVDFDDFKVSVFQRIGC